MVSARDITDAKRTAREEHINDDGTTDDADIFTHVPRVLGVEGWHRVEHKEEFHGKEYIFRRDDEHALVTMERSGGQWVVKGLGSIDYRTGFDFMERKHAEAEVVDLMLEHES